MFIYQTAKDRAAKLQQATLDELDGCHSELKVVHKDRTKLKFQSCYFEIMTFPNPNDKSKEVKCVVIAPEHHPAHYYDLEDLTELVETKYKGKKNKKVKVDLLREEAKKSKKELKAKKDK